ncbi:MAG: D-alanyl-D-alanine carboxypeptidase family protein [Geminicoccaceae bacterium]
MLAKLLSSRRSVLAGLTLLGAALLHHPAQAYDTDATAAILVDPQTDQVLYAKNPDVRLPPASMSKLMTVYLVFKRLKEGSLKLDDTFPVSEKAWRKGGSKMFVRVGDRVSIENLLQGIIVQSGNDACIVVAEGISGTVDAFAELMTRTAHEIGMSNSTFKNASGWPDPEHLTTVRDLATLAEILVTQFPEYYHFFSEKEFVYSGIKQHARNPLLYQDIGADGLKTGHTEAAGYGLVGSAVRDGRRLILVITGLKKSGARAHEAERLLDYGFREFKNYQLFAAGDAVEMANVWLGSTDKVPLVVQDDVVVSLTPDARRDLSVKVIYDDPIPAPVSSGAPVAQLEVSAPGLEARRMPLVAGAAVDSANLLGRMTGALNYLIFGPS